MIVLVLVVQDAVAVLLIVAGFGKAFSFPAFRRAVADYHLLSSRLVPRVASLVITSEIACGAFLLSGSVAPVGLVGAAVLLTIFAVAMTINLARGRRIHCGCAGARQARLISWWLVLRNVALVGLLIFGGVAFSAASSVSFVATRLPALLAALGLVMLISAWRSAAAIVRFPVVARQRTEAVS